MISFSTRKDVRESQDPNGGDDVTEAGFPWHDGDPDLHGGYWAPRETQYIRLLSSRKGQTHEAACDEAMDRLQEAWDNMAGHDEAARSRIVARVLESTIRDLAKSAPIAGDDISLAELDEGIARVRHRSPSTVVASETDKDISLDELDTALAAMRDGKR